MDLSDFSPASALLTVIALALAPFVAVMVTSFTKIVVVLSLLRNALGIQQIPPNVVLNGFALILSVYVMFPVGSAMYGEFQGQQEAGAIGDSIAGTEELLVAAASVKEPLRDFLLSHSAERDREFFLGTVRRLAANAGDTGLDPESLSARDFIVVIPAFTVAELTAAFQIGFLIFLPFVIVDLVISNILMAMGMQMLSPTLVSLPFKLLLFVLIDGWTRLAHGLVLSYL